MSNEQHINNLLNKFSAARQTIKRADGVDGSLWTFADRNRPYAFDENYQQPGSLRNFLPDRWGPLLTNVVRGNPAGGPNSVVIDSNEINWPQLLLNLPGQMSIGASLGTGVDRGIGLISFLARGGKLSDLTQPVGTTNIADMRRRLLALGANETANRAQMGSPGSGGILNRNTLTPGSVDLNVDQIAELMSISGAADMNPTVFADLELLASQNVPAQDLLEYMKLKNHYAGDPTINPETFKKYLIERQNPANSNLSYQQSRLGGGAIPDPGPEPRPVMQKPHPLASNKAMIETPESQAARAEWAAKNKQYQEFKNQLAAERAVTRPTAQQLAQGKLPPPNAKVRIDPNNNSNSLTKPKEPKGGSGVWDSITSFGRKIFGRNPEIQMAKTPIRNRFIGGGPTLAVLGAAAYPIVDDLLFGGLDGKIHASLAGGNKFPDKIQPFEKVPALPVGTGGSGLGAPRPISEVPNEKRDPRFKQPWWSPSF